MINWKHTVTSLSDRQPFVDRILYFSRTCVNDSFFQLFKTFTDTKYIYFLTDAHMGGTLFDLVKAKGQLEEDHTQFYAACITEAGFQIDHQ